MDLSDGAFDGDFQTFGLGFRGCQLLGSNRDRHHRLKTSSGATTHSHVLGYISV